MAPPEDVNNTQGKDHATAKSRVDLRGANLCGVSFAGMDLEGADFRAANLRGASFVGSKLRYADFRGASLHQANFRNASLYGAKLQGAEAFGADFQNCDLRQCNLAGAYLEGAVLPPPAERTLASAGQIAEDKASQEQAWDDRLREERSRPQDGSPDAKRYPEDRGRRSQGEQRFHRRGHSR
jgi:hypothetical protein